MLKLNIGAGSRALTPSGWIAVDLEGDSDILCDVTQGIPVPDRSCSAVFASHFLEHLTLDEARRFFSECQRVLEEGGVVRFSVPDLRLISRHYVRNNRDFLLQKNSNGSDRFLGETLADRLMFILNGQGHRHMFDAESLVHYLEEAGFSNVRSMRPFCSRLDDIESLDNRPELSLFVEGEKRSLVATSEPPVPTAPFMHETEVQLLLSCLRQFVGSVQALEWGSGYSTNYFSAHLPQGSHWDAIEHNEDWAKQVDSLLLGSGTRSVSLHYVANSAPFRDGLDDGDFDSFHDYVLYPTTLGKKYEFILVDGRARVECMQIGWMLLEQDGLMVLHDAERAEYDRGIPREGYCLRATIPLSDGYRQTLVIGKSKFIINRLLRVLKANLPSLRIDLSLPEFRPPLPSVDNLKRRAESSFLRGDFSGSLRLFLLAHEAGSVDPDTYNSLGVLYWKLGDRLASEDCFLAGLKLDPLSADLLANYSELKSMDTEREGG